MKSNLGKIVLFLSLLVNLFASNADITLSAPAIYKGDRVNFTITASGGAEFPNIQEIEGFPVTTASSSSSISIINGSRTETISKTYSFKPLKSVTIPSYRLKIDGKSYKTAQKRVEVLKPQASQGGDEFVIEMKVDKKELFVGQSAKLTVLFKQKFRAKADKLNLHEPKLENFWIKKIDGQRKSNDSQYIVQEFDYIIFPQKAGEFNIPALEADIGRVVHSRGGLFNDPFFSQISSQIEWSKIYSNNLKIRVKPLPNNLEVYGSFNIKTTVDKMQVYANKPVNLTITIDGNGNIDDIKKFDLNLAEGVVYADEPKIVSNLKDGIYGGTFTQKIVIIADKDFTIPKMTLNYFDKDLNKEVTISSNPIDIKVEGAKEQVVQPKVEQAKSNKTLTNTKQSIKERVVVKSDDAYIKYIFALIGLIIGSVSTYFFLKTKQNREKKDNEIVKEIKNAKDDKTLFEILLPYAKEEKTVSDILKLLEENIYQKTNHKIDKQKLYDIFLD